MSNLVQSSDFHQKEVKAVQHKAREMGQQKLKSRDGLRADAEQCRE